MDIMGQISDSLLASLSHVLGLKKKKKDSIVLYWRINEFGLLVLKKY